MAQQFDPSKIDFENMSPEQRQTLDYLRGLSQRGPSAIGTSGLTGEDVQTAGDIVEEAPTMMETGYGPKEFNPQQRYEQRYQMRSGVGDEEGPSAFENLQENVALGQMQETMPYQQPDFTPDGNGGTGMSGGDPTGTLGHFGMEAFTGILEDMGIKGLTTGGLASFLGASPELAARIGITSAATPAAILSMIAKTAFGSTLDMAAGQRSEDLQSEAMSTLSDVIGSDEALGDYTASDMVGLGMMDPTNVANREIENMSPFEKAQAAVNALAVGPKGGWTASTKGLQTGSDSMGIAGAMGLQSSFGDPFGTGLGVYGGAGGGGSTGTGPGSIGGLSSRDAQQRGEAGMGGGGMGDIGF